MADNVWRILAIDDDATKLGEIKENLVGAKRFLPDKIEVVTFQDFDKGIKALAEQRYDIVVLDLHAKSDPDAYANMGDVDQAGEKALDELKAIRFAPVIFYTGFPNKVMHLKSPIINIVTKGGNIEELRNAVGEVLSTKLPQLVRHMEEQQRQYMWSALEGKWGNLEREAEPAELAYLAARQVAYRLSRDTVRAALGITGNLINPLEMFLYPSPSDQCSPGDIVRDKTAGHFWIVLTPACDFEQCKAENVLMARIYPLSEHPLHSAYLVALEVWKKDKDGVGLAKGMNDARGEVLSLVKGRKGPRYSFFPQTFFLPDCVVDFQETRHVPLKNDDAYEQVCSLDSPFREGMLQRFSSYYGRIGTPDLDLDQIADRVKANLDSK